MIKEIKFGNILNCKEKNVAFAINAEGISDSKFAKQIASIGFDEIEKLTSHSLGSVISKQIDDKVYHALVCYSLRRGWPDQEETIRNCINNITSDEDIAIIEIGSEITHQAQGANLLEIKKGMQHANKHLVLYKNTKN